MRKRYLVGGGILAIAVGVLMYAVLNITYSLSVNELLDQGSELYGERVRVSGEVVNNSIEWDADKLELTFVITDLVTESGDDLLVVYQGARPSNFKEESHVTVEGEYCPDNIFQASTIIMKCPSRYEPEE